MLDTKTTRARSKPQPTITKLYADFKSALAAMAALPEGPNYERTISEAVKIAGRICVTPACSATEAKLKVRAAIWATNEFMFEGDAATNLDEVDRWQAGGTEGQEEIDALLSLRDDLLRLTSPDASQRAA
jgi:hypothetical protein